MSVNQVEFFRRVSGDNQFAAWLEMQKEIAVKYMAEATDPVAMYRAQGQYQLLCKQQELLEKARNLR